MAKMVLRAWRVQDAEPSGLMVWFDPERERIEIHELEHHPEDGVPAVRERDDLDLFGRSDQVNNSPESDDSGLPF